MENFILIHNLFFLVRLSRNNSIGDKNIIHMKIYWNQVPKYQIQSDSCNNTLPIYLKFKTSQELLNNPEISQKGKKEEYWWGESCQSHPSMCKFKLQLSVLGNQEHLLKYFYLLHNILQLNWNAIPKIN